MGAAGRLGRPGPHRRPGRVCALTADERAARAWRADELCRSAFGSTLDGRAEAGLALVAVGGYGRAELAPCSDLDVVLLHADDVDAGDLAGRLWYPLWDAGADVDHAVRALGDATEAARRDPRVALGLLDARHLAGDPNLTLQLRANVLAAWRRNAPQQLPAVRELVDARARRTGELAHAAVPDLKESLGGLRDATVLNALVATWLVDVPHAELERSRHGLLDIRDEVHALAGRASDRISPELWPELAARLGLTGAADAQRRVRELGRRVTHLSRLTWRRVDAALERPRSPRRRAPELVRVAPGVAVSAGEVVLDAGADPASDPALLLRAAAEAAERGLALGPATAARLSRSGAGLPGLPTPWSDDARNLLARLLAAGAGLLAVWETLDETGALARILPEWERVRLLPHASAVHRFTVDRHLVETCIEASRLIRRVARPDVLVVAALLHDIGKGAGRDHSIAGEPVAVRVAARLGFGEHEQALVGRLVRRHLLLSGTATTRDLDDPTTIDQVAEQVGDRETLDLLAALTEADARATAPQAWTRWRAALVADLVARVAERLQGPSPGATTTGDRRTVDIPGAIRDDPSRVGVEVEAVPHGSRVTVVSGGRVGLIADTAGALAVQRIEVRAARAWTQGAYAVSVWEVADPALDEAIVRQRIEAVCSGRLDPAERLRSLRGRDRIPPSVTIRHEASEGATVLEVRGTDRPGVVHDVCRALASLDLSVRSAHVTTLGPQAVDVFYVVEPGAGGLSDDRAADAAHAVRKALSATATLDA